MVARAGPADPVAADRVVPALFQGGRGYGCFAYVRPALDDPDLVLPGAPLVKKGPFRLVRHPNYLVVIAEIAVLPLAFGLWRRWRSSSRWLNAVVLAIRIRAEHEGLWL